MSFLKTFALLLILGSSFVACKKDDNDKPGSNPDAAPFIGKWTGTFGYDNSNSGYFFAINVKADGVIQELNASGVAKGQGTWTLQGTTLKGSYKMLFSPFNQYSVITKVNASTGKMEGSWGYDGDGGDGGQILLTKQ